jgi:predicted transcriptional regulator
LFIVRTLVDIPDDDIDRLDALAARSGRSRAAEIREAVRAHLLRKSGQDWIARGAGYWQGRNDLPGDGLSGDQA